LEMPSITAKRITPQVKSRTAPTVSLLL